MKVMTRDSSLKNGVAIKEDKMKICFMWLHEFKFSTFEMLSKLLGMELKSNYAFFKKLIEQEFIVTFKNKNVNDRTKFIAITQAGVNFLITKGLVGHEQKASAFSRFRKAVSIFHHLDLQNYLIENLSKYSEVIWEVNVKVKLDEIKPDAVVIYKSNGMKVAIEYEKWAKSRKRIFSNFYKHVQNLNSNYYSGVIYLFADEKDQKKYENIFNLAEWERYRSKGRDGKLNLMAGTFKPSSIEGLHKAFVFRLI